MMEELSNLEMINKLIETTCEAIEKLQSRYIKAGQVDDTVKLTKAIARLTEDVRKLLRMRAKIQKEGEKI